MGKNHKKYMHTRKDVCCVDTLSAEDRIGANDANILQILDCFFFIPFVGRLHRGCISISLKLSNKILLNNNKSPFALGCFFVALASDQPC